MLGTNPTELFHGFGIGIEGNVAGRGSADCVFSVLGQILKLGANVDGRGKPLEPDWNSILFPGKMVDFGGVSESRFGGGSIRRAVDEPIRVVQRVRYGRHGIESRPKWTTARRGWCWNCGTHNVSPAIGAKAEGPSRWWLFVNRLETVNIARAHGGKVWRTIVATHDAVLGKTFVG